MVPGGVGEFFSFNNNYSLYFTYRPNKWQGTCLQLVINRQVLIAEDIAGLPAADPVNQDCCRLAGERSTSRSTLTSAPSCW